jgi:ABC-type multidrug transport system fused ATPase/permease subunit
VERGTHAELIASTGVYSELYRTQLDTEMRIVAEAV